jgi:hypothetical protein
MVGLAELMRARCGRFYSGCPARLGQKNYDAIDSANSDELFWYTPNERFKAMTGDRTAGDSDRRGARRRLGGSLTRQR